MKEADLLQFDQSHHQPSGLIIPIPSLSFVLGPGVGLSTALSWAWARLWSRVIGTMRQAHVGSELGRGCPLWKECHSETAMEPDQELENLRVERGLGGQPIHHSVNTRTFKVPWAQDVK